MQTRRVGHRHFLRIDRGEEIVAVIEAYVRKQGIEAGSLSGIGAVDGAVLLMYRLEEKSYDRTEVAGPHELVSLLGNVSVRDGKSWPHMHAVLSDGSGVCRGGHLEHATVGVTCEVIIDASDATIERGVDEETGLKLWKLEI